MTDGGSGRALAATAPLLTASLSLLLSLLPAGCGDPFLAPPQQPGRQPLVLEDLAGQTALLPVAPLYVTEVDAGGQPDLVLPRPEAVEWHGSADEVLHRQTSTDHVDD